MEEKFTEGGDHMNRLPELIAAYLAMDHFARNIIVESAKTYALTRPYSGSRGQLRVFPGALNNHPTPDGISNAQKECLVSSDGDPIDEK